MVIFIAYFVLFDFFLPGQRSRNYFIQTSTGKELILTNLRGLIVLIHFHLSIDGLQRVSLDESKYSPLLGLGNAKT